MSKCAYTKMPTTCTNLERAVTHSVLLFNKIQINAKLHLRMDTRDLSGTKIHIFVQQTSSAFSIISRLYEHCEPSLCVDGHCIDPNMLLTIHYCLHTEFALFVLHHKHV